MNQIVPPLGHHMRAELGDASTVFAHTATLDVSDTIAPLNLSAAHAFYTIARGSSDAAANILSYEFMRELGKPMTSLPPSVFSVGDGVSMAGAVGLAISQSGASDDLVRTARGVKQRGGTVLALTNVPGSRVELESDVTLPIRAGEELAVPATKTVIGSVAVGLSLLAALQPAYADRLAASATCFEGLGNLAPKAHQELREALLRARHIYVVGRDTGFGAAQEIALKIKETCAIHAEAYSASEVLHGPLQLATNSLTVLVLDTQLDIASDSLDHAFDRFQRAGIDVHRICLHQPDLTPAATAAGLLRGVYPVILETALALGLNPDAPSALSKVTVTR